MEDGRWAMVAAAAKDPPNDPKIATSRIHTKAERPEKRPRPPTLRLMVEKSFLKVGSSPQSLPRAHLGPLWFTPVIE